MNDDFIQQFGKPRPPRREFTAALFQRIQQPMQPPARKPLFRSLAAALTVLAVLTVTLFVSPPARAFADGIIRQIGFYVFIQGEVKIDPTKQALRDQGSEKKPVVEKDAAQAKPANPDQNLKNLPGAPNAAAASQMAGFPVLAPAYLPAGYTPRSDWTLTGKNGRTQIVSIGFANLEGQVLFINQSQADSSTPPETVTLPEVQDVTVRGQPGVWLPNGKHSLVWVENGITISISSTGLGLEETLKIAESLGK